MNMELLSPAGSFEALRAAVENGADAVYFGGGEFNARRFADNFAGDEMKRALAYCHEHGVSAHITLNILLLDRELSRALDYAAELYELGADALIVQDLGLVRELLRELPKLPLHASTQMGIHDLSGVQAVGELGFSRAVLSREVPLCEIDYIHKHCDLPLECFAHGAMCVSFSGECLMSSMAGERSGNRGTCAQPCRKQYRLENKGGYLLSMADLCMLRRLPELERAGVASIKLEGRMKRPEYVAAVTRAYRAALSGAGEKELQSELECIKRVFDRGGFHYGYYDGRNRFITGCQAEKSPSKELLTELRNTYRTERRRRPVSMALTLRVGEAASLTASLSGVTVTCTGEVVQLAQKPQNPERVLSQLAKLGDTPFAAGEMTLSGDENAFLPASSLNALRREAVSRLSEWLSSGREPVSVSYLPPENAQPQTKPVLSVKVRTVEQAKAALSSGAEEILFEPESYQNLPYEELSALSERVPLLLALPAVMLMHSDREHILRELQNPVWAGAEVSALGQIALLKPLCKRIVASPMLNAMNANTVRFLRELGVERVSLSRELTKPQIRDLIKKGGTALEAYARVPVMQLLHCPVKQNLGCRHCRGQVGTLTDEAGRAFPMSHIVESDGCLVRLLNCNRTDIVPFLSELPCPEAVSLAFDLETPEEVASAVARAKRALLGETCTPEPDSTRGHFTRPVD